MTSNFLLYIVYQQRRPKYQKAIEFARIYREAFLTYGTLNRVMKAAVVSLDRKIYYNIKIRDEKLREEIDELTNLLNTL